MSEVTDQHEGAPENQIDSLAKGHRQLNGSPQLGIVQRLKDRSTLLSAGRVGSQQHQKQAGQNMPNPHNAQIDPLELHGSRAIQLKNGEIETTKSTLRRRQPDKTLSL